MEDTPERLGYAAEAALRESEERFRDFAESTSDWFWETDAAHCFTFSSGMSKRERGMPPSALIGKARWELALVDVDADAWTKHRADLEARRPFRDFQYAHLDPQGRRRVVRINGKPVFDARGTFRGYRGTGRNVTAEVEAQRDRRRFLAAIEQVNDGIALWDSEDRLVA